MSGAGQEFEVAIVGAGPGGLASAITLGSYGFETLVVERRHSPSTLPRANTASTGTMELLRRWGLEEAARERSIDVEMQPLALPTLAAAGDGQTVEAGFPTRAQAALISPTAPASLGQAELEPLLGSASARSRALVSNAGSSSPPLNREVTAATCSRLPVRASAVARCARGT